MGIAIPQVITPSKASGAQVIDGSLKFKVVSSNASTDGTDLRRTPSSSGNMRTHTWSSWIKRTTYSFDQQIFYSGVDANNTAHIRFDSDDTIIVFDYTNTFTVNPSRKFRDTGWYHVVVAIDTTQSTSSDRVKIYVNGNLETSFDTASYPAENLELDFNRGSTEHSIGRNNVNGNNYFCGSLSQVYWIDGQALGPEYFGFTDPLTNTWKPKKYTGTFGTNGFYLPMDGNSLIGEDKSGNGNDFTPVNFGGSVALDSSAVSGARPILNTTQGGAQAGVGVFGSRENVGYAVTVYNDGGGNKYYIDGVKQDTVTGLIRGATYTFDTSDSTVSSHPFRFSATSNGSHGGGSEYTNGVAAITGAATTITVPHDAPNTLYYYCTSHSGMGADITGITTNEKLADQYASHCVLALPLVGANSDVSTSIACTSTTKSMTNNGDVAASSDTSNFYNGSFEFDGTGDYISSPNSTDYAFGTGDFTVECWWNIDVTNTNQIFIENWTSGTGWQLYFRDSGDKIAWYVNSGILIEDTNAYTTGKWHHAAVCRSNGTTKLYIDGDEKASASDSTNYSTTQTLTLGRQQSTNTNLLNGYLQDVRVYKGVAKYTSNFVPASTSPDILPDTPSGVSGGSKLTKITDGAVSFDGTNDYLTIADSDDFNLGSGAFTIEGFCYLRSSNAQQFLVGMWTGNQLSYAVQTSNDANRYLRFLISDDGTSVDFDKVSTGSLRLNGWSHFAVTRSGNTFYLFVDGILVGTQSGSQTLHNSTGTLAIGARNDGTQDLNGLISNVRIIKGTALYTSRFTPPTAPLTNVTNTKLLTCQSTTKSPGTASYDDAVLIMPMNGSNGGTTFTDISASAHTPSSVAGNTNTSTTQSKFYGSSGYFDGTGDYIDMGDSDDWVPQLGWTVEMWVYITGGTGTQRSLISQAGSGASNQSFQILIQATNKFACSIRYTGTNWADANSNSAIPENQWVHLAVVVESGGTVKLYVDGTAQTETASFSGSGYNTSEEMWIGGQAHPSYPAYFTGYMNDVAMYQTAKYTSNFTPTTTGLLNSQPSIPSAVSPGTVTPNGDAAVTNFNPFNTDINKVRGQETGYATLNPITRFVGTLTDGNLNVEGSRSNDWSLTITTTGITSGKFYWEYHVIVQGSTQIGICQYPSNDKLGADSKGYGYILGSGRIDHNNTDSAYGNAIVAGDVLGIAYDSDNSKLYFYKNGIIQNGGTPAATSIESATWYPGISIYGNSSAGNGVFNFGQKPFKFSPPDGYQPLNAANNRPVNVISRPDQYVGVTTYTGDGNSSGRRINTGFRPDLIWLKSRGSGNHGLYDSVRGPDKRLQSDNTAAEGTVVFPGASNFGFDFGSETYYNASSTNYIAWTWKAGGNKNTFNVDDVGYATAAAAGLTAGDASIVTGSSVGTKQGFSIISYTSAASDAGTAEIPHGLSQTPDFVVIKNRDTATTSQGWPAWHSAVPSKSRALDNTSGWDSTEFSYVFNNTNPTSTVVHVSSNASVSSANRYRSYGGSDKFIMYSWHNVPGLQKFGTYTGNANGDGMYVELGFKASIIFFKRSSTTSNWVVWSSDGEGHNQYNALFNYQDWDTSDAEANLNGRIDVLSNGFKFRDSGFPNDSATFIYGAWAEAPSIDLYGGGANAR